jgi:DNA polymerase III subunit delta'
MLFTDVVGQNTAKAQLLGMWQQNRLPHAILICGQEGVGGLAFSLAFAQYLLCQNKGTEDCCGQCPNCTKVSKMEHADLHFSFPSIKPNSQSKVLSSNYIKEFRSFIKKQPYSTTYDWLQNIKAENKQGNISADECRAIIESLALKSYEGGQKILIMWRPEFLGKEGNILLKLIEEPPANTIILLVAESEESILPTILSRVQLVKLPPIKTSEIAFTLINQLNTEPKKAHQIALMAEGSFSEALSLLQHLENDQFTLVRNFFNFLFTHNGLSLSKFIDDLAKQGREQQKGFLKYVIHLLEATLKQKYTGQSKLLNEELLFVQKLASFNISFEVLSSLIDELNKTSYYIQRNANSKIQLLSMSIKMAHAIQNKKVSSPS